MGRAGKPGYDRFPVASASIPVQGVPSGPEKSIVSKYVKCKFGLDGLATVALGCGVKIILNL